MEQTINYFNSVEAARILGVNVSSIKRWTDEGTLECVKTAGGHRKFTLQHLANYLRLHESKINKANFFPLESDEDLELSFHTVKGNYDRLIEYIVEKSLQCRREKVQRVLNGLYLGQFPLHDIYDSLVTPVLHNIGDLWEKGELSITEEHMSTQTIRDCLIRLQGIIRKSAAKLGTAFCLTMSEELHDVAIKMVDHILEIRGFTILCSGQMTPSIDMKKIFEIFHPNRVYISSTIVANLNLDQAEFDKICYIAEAYNAQVYVGGRGFDALDFSHSAVAKRLYTFKEVYSH